ncbi:MAG: cell division protein FtsQ/DivIB [Rhodospirillales bacterium]
MADKKTETNDTQTADNRRARKSGAPRKRVLRGQVSRAVGMGALVAVLAGAGGGGWWVWSNDVVPQLYTKAQTWTVDQTAEAGLRIDDIFVTGRSQTTRDDLLAALKLTRGAPIFGFDPDEARERVEKLPWVKRAVVERMLPGTVMLHIEERSPLALWQNKGVFHLIDDEGVVILNKGLERFSDLPIVVGPEAPRHAKALLETLKAEPDLMNQVRAAVWVSGRRWTLTLDNGIDVQLPEDDLGGAWLRLAEYERQHKVLDRDVEVLDLRLPDRLIVRKAAKPRPPRKPKGQET